MELLRCYYPRSETSLIALSCTYTCTTCAPRCLSLQLPKKSRVRMKVQETGQTTSRQGFAHIISGRGYYGEHLWTLECKIRYCITCRTQKNLLPFHFDEKFLKFSWYKEMEPQVHTEFHGGGHLELPFPFKNLLLFLVAYLFSRWDSTPQR